MNNHLRSEVYRNELCIRTESFSLNWWTTHPDFCDFVAPQDPTSLSVVHAASLLVVVAVPNHVIVFRGSGQQEFPDVAAKLVETIWCNIGSWVDAVRTPCCHRERISLGAVTPETFEADIFAPTSGWATLTQTLVECAGPGSKFLCRDVSTTIPRHSTTANHQRNIIGSLHIVHQRQQIRCDLHGICPSIAQVIGSRHEHHHVRASQWSREIHSLS